jgi:hypothetical protein
LAEKGLGMNPSVVDVKQDVMEVALMEIVDVILVGY